MATTAAEHAAWAQQGSVDASRRTYASVREALSRSSELQRIDYEVFLQGSYANNTNTRGDSDVDVVVMMTSTFMPETTRLTALERSYYARDRIPGTTSAPELRDMVGRALRSYYGAGRVESKNKCIKVAKREGYVDADVVPALQHRLLTSYNSIAASNWIEGISITPLQGDRIVNYPKEHIKNGQAKNATAGGYYKQAVRQVKRLRRKAVDFGLLSRTDAPGYLLECLVSNVPDHLFVADTSQRLRNIVAYLTFFKPESLLEMMWSGDRIHKLFDDDPGEHNQCTAARVLDVLWKLL